MNLSEDYRRQFGWRDWPSVFAALPRIEGSTVLDVGCGIGDQAAELVARGAKVLGVDLDESLVSEARVRGLKGATFRVIDLREPLGLGEAVDGVWCSFTAAYFVDLQKALRDWTGTLRSGGWVVLTEIDDLFGHEPVAERTRSLFAAYAQDALEAKRYDFHMGRKLEQHCRGAGLTVERGFEVADSELSFAGPATDVIDGWRARFDRMQLLRSFCGAEFEAVREDFLACLSRDEHRSLARVRCCLARRD